MHHWLKLSHHRHTGKLHAHEYTSYGPLMVLLVVVGLALVVCSASALSHPGPQSGSVGLTGIMPGKPPATAATITTPSSGQHFGTSPITISGTCPQNTLVELYKNDIFAGSTTCDDKGHYSLQVDLMLGKNILMARVYNDLNEPGPDSNKITVYYDAVPAQASPISSLSLSGAQLVLNTNAVYRGTFPGQRLDVPIDILGGTAPYAINVEWGDGSNKIVPRNNNLSFSVNHVYQKAGVYQITLQGTDSQDRTAFLTVAAIINGQPSVALSSSNGSTSAQNKLLVLWPLYTSAAAIVISFWLGERREKQLLTDPGLRWHPQL